MGVARPAPSLSISRTCEVSMALAPSMAPTSCAMQRCPSSYGVDGNPYANHQLATTPPCTPLSRTPLGALPTNVAAQKLIRNATPSQPRPCIAPTDLV
ncbi:uncharacterized protein CcaverHIS019_0106470 [Cutaneotrichosporon cavernicola]|uniref:Uncharacterized protein n=1 Tax=Cutaneotrichosporon cavernicola TaxID=279322 RepID=A0AA48I1P0_9TREE|nr:uncharacterized protein CcaverHIS019_0106470 [Cutaneotrichosporon cavernicola]BEI87929.1 hypothetical protein CcaverHIS019_0106470 [Cutaneotrichosporon cavernicola]